MLPAFEPPRHVKRSNKEPHLTQTRQEESDWEEHYYKEGAGRYVRPPYRYNDSTSSDSEHSSTEKSSYLSFKSKNDSHGTTDEMFDSAVVQDDLESREEVNKAENTKHDRLNIGPSKRGARTKKRKKTKNDENKKTKYKTYEAAAGDKALAAYLRGEGGYKTLAKRFKIPVSTLRSKLKQSKSDKKGPKGATYLSVAEEDALENFVIHNQEMGFPLTKEDLIDTAELMIKSADREIFSASGRPTDRWYYQFLKRHPGLTIRKVQDLHGGRSSVTKEKIHKWFKNHEDYLRKKGLAEFLYNEVDPRRIWNCDETNFLFLPDGKGVLARTGSRRVVRNTGGKEKTNMTVMFCVNAKGEYLKPFVVYKYGSRKIRKDVIESCPENIVQSASESGWMRGDTMLEFVKNPLNEFLKQEKIQVPILLFLDGHASHITIALSEYCEENKIELVLLPPNATFILQPLDVAVFKSLKDRWRKFLRKKDFEMRRQGIMKFDITKKNFATVLGEFITNEFSSYAIKSGFRACGIYPWNKDAVQYHKLLKQSEFSIQEQTSKTQQTKNTLEETSLVDCTHLSILEKWLGPAKLQGYVNTSIESSLSKDEDSIYGYWQFLKTTLQEKYQAEKEIQELPVVELQSHIAEEVIRNNETTHTTIAADHNNSISNSVQENTFAKELSSPENKSKRVHTPTKIDQGISECLVMPMSTLTAKTNARSRPYHQHLSNIEYRTSKTSPAPPSPKKSKKEKKNLPETHFDDYEAGPSTHLPGAEKIDPKLGSYYAVFYDENMYVGRILDFPDEGIAKMKFLQLLSAASWTYGWPKRDDIANVEWRYIFSGPIELIGNGPFKIVGHSDVQKTYKAIKARMRRP